MGAFSSKEEIIPELKQQRFPLSALNRLSAPQIAPNQKIVPLVAEEKRANNYLKQAES